MDVENVKDIAAIWGAITGSISILWAVYAETTKRRPKLRVKVSSTIWKKHPPDPGDRENEFINIEFVNVGLSQVVLEGFAYCHLGNPHWLVVNPGTTGRPLPRRLDPGETHLEMIPFRQFVNDGVDPRWIALHGYDPMGRRFWSKGWRWIYFAWSIRWLPNHMGWIRQKLNERKEVRRRVREGRMRKTPA